MGRGVFYLPRRFKTLKFYISKLKILQKQVVWYGIIIINKYEVKVVGKILFSIFISIVDYNNNERCFSLLLGFLFFLLFFLI